MARAYPTPSTTFHLVLNYFEPFAFVEPLLLVCLFILLAAAWQPRTSTQLGVRIMMRMQTPYG